LSTFAFLVTSVAVALLATFVMSISMIVFEVNHAASLSDIHIDILSFSLLACESL
jgi:hypothetical protein